MESGQEVQFQLPVPLPFPLEKTQLVTPGAPARPLLGGWEQFLTLWLQPLVSLSVRSLADELQLL